MKKELHKFSNVFNMRIYFFRPDLYLHSLKVIDKTYKISLGYVLF
jgi:hypothetical protein